MFMKRNTALSVIPTTELPGSVTVWATAGDDRLVQVTPTTQSRQRMAAPALGASVSPFICGLWFLGFYGVSLLGISGLMMGLRWLLGLI